jgi:hypothetical protein
VSLGSAKPKTVCHVPRTASGTLHLTCCLTCCLVPQSTERYPPDHLYWRQRTSFAGFNATRIMANIGDHSHITTLAYYRSALLPPVQKCRLDVPTWRACYIES